MQIGPATHQTDGTPAVEFSCTESHSWSKTQSLVALSSAESVVYALVSAEALGFQSVIRDLGPTWSTVVCSDAIAAFGVIHRQGLGRLRNVDCNFLSVQTLNARKVVHNAKVLGSDHLADICLNVELMTRHEPAVDGRCNAGRPTLCPEVTGI